MNKKTRLSLLEAIQEARRQLHQIVRLEADRHQSHLNHQTRTAHQLNTALKILNSLLHLKERVDGKP